MGRLGMVTIGIAIQAETLSNSNSPSPVNFSSSSTPESFSSKSSIFLPPSKNGAPQTLRITFTYNKETNLPEIVVNLDGPENEDKYLALKDLCRGNVTGLNFTELELTESPDLKPQPSNHFTPTSTTPKAENIAQDLQVYYFDKVKMDSKVTETSESLKGSQDLNKNESPETNSKNNDSGIEHSPSPAASKTRSSSKGATEARKGSNDGKQKKHKTKAKMTENRGTTISPDRRSPTKDISDKSRIPIIHSSSTGFLPCEYYRQKIYQEVGGFTEFPSSCWSSTSFSSIQKTAGQKVVNKLAAQQKQLEELASLQRRRTEFVFHEELGFCEVPEKIPLKKKQTRLEPLRPVPKCF